MKIFKFKKKSFITKTKDCFNSIKMSFEHNFLDSKIKYSLLEVLIIVFVMTVFGIIIGSTIFNNMSSNKLLRDFINTYDEITNDYYMDIDEEKLLESGIKGMFDYLKEPYSEYIDPIESKSFKEKVDGKYIGIGAEITYDEIDNNITKIYSLYENGPSFKIGLSVGDIILKVNDINVYGKSIEEISDLVKGDKNTYVNVTVNHDSVEKTFKIKREEIEIKSVTSSSYIENDQKIGYLGVSIFADNTDEQFKKELTNLEKDNIKGLVIDLRNNNGGYLKTATSIISLFTKSGSTIYRLNTKGKEEIFKDKTKDSRNYPIAILVNGGSASASELMASSLLENDLAKIIGTTTFGKGLVQKTLSLSNKSIIKYTFQSWLTPKGNSIDKVGLNPTIYIEYENDGNSIDNQLKKALVEVSNSVLK